MSLTVTCGEVKEASFGTPFDLPGSGTATQRLADFLSTTSPRNIWWTPYRWENNHRAADKWLGSWAIVIDIDYHDSNGKHVTIPQELADLVLQLLREGSLPGGIGHLTPRGFRLVVVLEEGVVTDGRLFSEAIVGFAAQVASALRDVDLSQVSDPAGFHVDEAAFDLARIFYLANTLRPVPCDEGTPTPRKAEIVVMREQPLSATELALQSPAPDPKTRGRRADEPGAGEDYVEAALRWCRDHPLDYPSPGSGTCPICNHNDCFGRLKDDHERWACFSAGHGDAAGVWLGQHGQGCWFGSSLDLQAHKRGCKPSDVLRDDNPGGPPHDGSKCSSSATTTPADKTFEVTDSGNAERFVTEARRVVRQCAGLGWLGWNGVQWTKGQAADALVYGLAKRLAHKFHSEAALAAQTTDYKDLLGRARRAASRQGLEAMLALASKDALLQVDATDLDADPHLLNCPNGIVDLRTGELMPHDPKHLMTHLAGVPYDPEAKCPIWDRTVIEIFAAEDQAEMIDFVQLAFGYTLTGLTREEIFFLLWGDGRNGKGTIVKVLQHILGSYACVATMGLFLSQKNDSGKNFELAGLAGARLVVASEANADRSFDTSVLKMFTGSDKRRACHKHKPLFEYIPTDKLWLLVNDKPRVPSWDPAFGERCRLMPFENQFTVEKGNLDPNRKAKLLEELPGILAWAVRGSIRYFKEGMRAPKRVRVAVAEYRKENTRVAEFLDQHFMEVKNGELAQSRIYAHYRAWCQQQGCVVVADTRFGAYLADAGYDSKKGREGKIVLHIGVKDGVVLPGKTKA
jgi:P4 family phage/plasmid primase-like protien